MRTNLQRQPRAPGRITCGLSYTCRAEPGTALGNGSRSAINDLESAHHEAAGGQANCVIWSKMASTSLNPASGTRSIGCGAPSRRR